MTAVLLVLTRTLPARAREPEVALEETDATMQSVTLTAAIATPGA